MVWKRALVGAVAGALSVTSVAGPAAAQTSTPASESSACRYGRWPADLNGQPASFAPGAATGLYLWHTETGWHMRVTHPGDDKVVFRGAITSASPLRAVERRTESRDVMVSVSRTKVSFRFTNHGKVDGIDFRVACGRGFSVNGTVNGERLTADQVFIGADGHHPPAVPFRIARQA